MFTHWIRRAATAVLQLAAVSPRPPFAASQALLVAATAAPGLARIPVWMPVLLQVDATRGVLIPGNLAHLPNGNVGFVACRVAVRCRRRPAAGHLGAARLAAPCLRRYVCGAMSVDRTRDTRPVTPGLHGR